MRKRSKFNLSFMNLFSAKMGYLIPIGIKEVLPGDTFQHSTSLFMRLAPLVSPTMHPVNVRIHHWYIPLRLLWDDFEKFITGGDDGLDDSVPPYITSETGWAPGSLADYLGVPTGVPNLTISALPLRAYSLLWNECYRDQDLQAEAVFSKDSGLDTTSVYGIQRADWEKDYFTTARPWPQKGADVVIPMSVDTGTLNIVKNTQGYPAFNHTATYSGVDAIVHAANMGNVDNPLFVNEWSTDNVLRWGNNVGLEVQGQINSGGVSLSDIREGFAIQRFQEARANYGSRYTEYLRYYGIRPSDSRLQRPEFLGGSKSVIQFSEVLQTSQTTSDNPLGSLGGHGMAASRSPRYRRWFEEHGFVISVMTVRPKAIYSQGLDRMWTRQTKYDYFTPELQSIGDQEVLNKELYAASSDPDGVFGYQERYQEYKASQSQVHGEMRTVLDSWHMARQFENQPVLNSDFVTCNPTDRIFAATNNDQLYCMAQHNIIARRLVKR